MNLVFKNNKLIGVSLIILSSLFVSQISSASCTFSIDENWGSGANARIEIVNDTGSTVSDWYLHASFPNSTISNSWGDGAFDSSANYQWNSFDYTYVNANEMKVLYMGLNLTSGSSFNAPTMSGTFCGGGVAPTETQVETQTQTQTETQTQVETETETQTDTSEETDTQTSTESSDQTQFKVKSIKLYDDGSMRFQLIDDQGNALFNSNCSSDAYLYTSAWNSILSDRILAVALSAFVSDSNVKAQVHDSCLYNNGSVSQLTFIQLAQ